MTKVDLRTTSVSTAPVVVATSGSPITVGAMADYRVVDAPRAVFQTQDYRTAAERLLRDAVVETLSAAAPSLPGEGAMAAARVQVAYAAKLTTVGLQAGPVRLQFTTAQGVLEFVGGEPLGRPTVGPERPLRR